jgi:hypothetical protein
VDRFLAGACQHFHRLITIARDADDDRFVARDDAAFDELLRGRDGDATRGFREDALGFRQQTDAFDDGIFFDHGAAAAGGANGAEYLKPVSRIADGNRLGQCVGLHRVGELDVRAQLECAHDGSATCGLRRVDGRLITVDETEVPEFVDALENTRQQRAAGHRGNDMFRDLPAKLFDDFEPVGLGALGVVRAKIDVGKAPAVLVGHLRAQPVDVVVIAADGNDARIVNCSAGDLAWFQVVGNENRAFESQARGV